MNQRINFNFTYFLLGTLLVSCSPTGENVGKSGFYFNSKLSLPFHLEPSSAVISEKVLSDCHSRKLDKSEICVLYLHERDFQVLSSGAYESIRTNKEQVQYRNPGKDTKKFDFMIQELNSLVGKWPKIEEPILVFDYKHQSDSQEDSALPSGSTFYRAYLTRKGELVGFSVSNRKQLLKLSGNVDQALILFN